MLKLENFKLEEIQSTSKIKGGEFTGPSIWGTETYVNFLGWHISTGSKGDSCSSCDS